MNPDEMDDNQIMRLVTLGMAIVWTATGGPGFPGVFDIAEAFAAYIETGEKADQ